MSYFKFQILPKDELMQIQEAGIYRVRDVATIKDVDNRLHDAKIGYNADGPEYIMENFDAYFSILVHGKKLEKHIIDKGFEQILRSFKQFTQSLRMILDEDNEFGEEQLVKMCNTLQMTIYIVSGFVTLYDSIYNKDDTDILGKKKRGTKKRDDNWTIEKHETLTILYNCIQLPINRLWDPPIPESEFTNLVANTCYKALEDPLVKTEKPLRDTIFQILGTLIKEFNHGMDCPSRLVKLIQNHEHTVSPISAGVCMLVKDYGCKSLINRLIRDIVDWQTNESASLTAAEIKQCSTFLVELAVLLPDKMIPEIMFLGDQLDNDSYQFRMTILSILTEVITVLSGEGLSEDAKEQRDSLLDLLEEHFYDVNSFCRSKTIQLWGKLQQEQAIPLSRQHGILKKVIERLRDKTMTVRKQAIVTVKIFLECNPFSSTLNVEEIKQKLIDETAKLDEIKAKLKTCEPSDEKKTHWVLIHKELRKFIKQKLEEEAASTEDSFAETQTRVGLQEAIEQIETLLFEKQYEEAYDIVRLAEKQHDDSKEDRKKMTIEARMDLLLEIFHNLFIEAGVIQKSNITPDQLRQLKELNEKQEQIISFFTATLDFAGLFAEAAVTIKYLIRSKASGECIEAIDYFTTARNFSIQDNIDGVLEMLSLVYLKEQDRKEAVVKAFKTMFLTTTAKSDRGHSYTIIKNLTLLIKNIEKGHYFALKSIIIEWVKNGDIRHEEIKLLWEIFTLKQPDTSDSDSRAALLLLDIVSEAKPEIVTVNFNVLTTVLQSRGLEDFRITETIASMMSKLGKTVHAPRGIQPGFRYSRDSEIVQIYENILKDGWKYNDRNYLSMSVQIINFFYELCDHPDIICENLIKHFYTSIYDSQDLADNNSIPVYMYLQFVTLLGHIGVRQLIFLDVTIYKELKRRNLVRDQSEKKKKELSKSVKSKKKRSPSVSSEISLQEGQSNDTNISTHSASLSRKQQNAIDEEQMAVEGAVADDADAEYIFDVLENIILSEESLLGKLVKLLVSMCQNPGKCTDEQIMTASVQSLTKMLTISQSFTEQHIQLVFTILGTSKNDNVRSNVILALSDLTKRFPNLLEPWTPHIYKRLRDESVSVRETALMILSHLIHHDMVRVKGQISEMALCLVDKEASIQKNAQVFFRQLAQKGNALYNVLPDIISKLCDPSAEVSEDDFKSILKHILDLIHKEKLMESLVAKLCVRFRVSTTSVRQWCDLAYCLSIINYNDRALRHLIDNIPTFKEKLHDQKVYNYFKNIVNTTGKNMKPEIKALSAQLNEKIENCLRLDEGQGGNDNEQRQDEEEDNNIIVETAKTVRKHKKFKKGDGNKARNKLCDDSSDEGSVLGSVEKSGSKTYGRRTKSTTSGKSVLNESSDENCTVQGESERRTSRRTKASNSKTTNKIVDESSDSSNHSSIAAADESGVRSLRKSRNKKTKKT